MDGRVLNDSASSMQTADRFPPAVLFDLDGTLLDSAPDMLATANLLRQARGQGPMQLGDIRPHVSRGSRAMLAAAFPAMSSVERDQLVQEFLDTYQGLSGTHAVLFPGVDRLLSALDAAGVVWGIVTNKPEYLAREILPVLGWQQRCAVLIGGDTLAEKKPHPLPLQVAAQRIDRSVMDCVYVGDDERDIVAARAAKMLSVAALWGYRQADEQPALWGADLLCESADELVDPACWSFASSTTGHD